MILEGYSLITSDMSWQLSLLAILPFTYNYIEHLLSTLILFSVDPIFTTSFWVLGIFYLFLIVSISYTSYSIQSSFYLLLSSCFLNFYPPHLSICVRFYFLLSSLLSMSKDASLHFHRYIGCKSVVKFETVYYHKLLIQRTQLLDI